MPELPEVETVRRGLERLIVGKTVADMEVLRPVSFRFDTGTDISRDLIGAKITAARRRAKLLILDLDNAFSLVTHLKMTGQMIVVLPNERWGGGHPNDSFVGHLPDNSTRIIFTFADKATLFFNDQRVFGWVHLMPTKNINDLDFVQKLGPEPLEGDPWPKFSKNIVRHTGSPIKAALLDQSVIAGLGNIYVDETLWTAKIHPSTRVGSLTEKDFRLILQSAIGVLTRAIDLGGSTDRNYVDAEGRRGAYLAWAKVFRQEGKPCERCGTPIEKIRVAGRGTHVCPSCQRISHVDATGKD